LFAIISVLIALLSWLLSPALLRVLATPAGAEEMALA